MKLSNHFLAIILSATVAVSIQTLNADQAPRDGRLGILNKKENPPCIPDDHPVVEGPATIYADEEFRLKFWASDVAWYLPLKDREVYQTGPYLVLTIPDPGTYVGALSFGGTCRERESVEFTVTVIERPQPQPQPQPTPQPQPQPQPTPQPQPQPQPMPQPQPQPMPQSPNTTDEFTVDGPGNKLDIVIVDDNSASMIEEQNKMSKKFSTFISRLNGIDWQLGIITTDAREGKQAWKGGKLLPFDEKRGIYFINSKTPDAQNLFNNTICRHEIGYSTEEGIKALGKMLNRAENKSFFRPRAHFASIVVSDEDEHSDGEDFTAENHPDYIMNKVQSVLGASYSNHSIVLHPGRKICYQAGDYHLGNTYLDLSRKTGGITGDLCANDYGDILKNIGDHMRNSTFSVMLKCVPLDGIQVMLMPPPQTSPQYLLNGQRLNIVPYPAMGTKVTVKYRCP